MCHTVSPAGMLCHLAAWGMASESGQHDNMAFSKLSKSLGFMEKLLVWVFKWTNRRQLNFHSKKTYEDCYPILAGCCQLDFLKNDQARHGLGMDYIVQSKLPN